MGAQQKTWRDSMTFLTPDYEEQDVCGQTLRFYPVSLGMAFKLRRLAAPVVAVISQLFTKDTNDFGSRTTSQKNAEGFEMQEQVIEAISPELARERHRQWHETLASAIDTAADPETLNIIGEIFIDSLRDQFPREDRKSRPPGAEFMDAIPLPALPAMLAGLAKANKGVFGPLTVSLSPLLDRAVAAVTDKLAEQKAAEAKESGEAPASSA